VIVDGLIARFNSQSKTENCSNNNEHQYERTQALLAQARIYLIRQEDNSNQYDTAFDPPRSP
jgi:hypothetical protein